MRLHESRKWVAIALTFLGLGGVAEAQAQVGSLESLTCELPLSPEDARLLFAGLNPPNRRSRVSVDEPPAIFVESAFAGRTVRETEAGFEAGFIVTSAVELRKFGRGLPARMDPSGFSFEVPVLLDYDAGTQILRATYSTPASRSIAVTVEAVGRVPLGAPIEVLGTDGFGLTSSERVNGSPVHLGFEERRTRSGRDLRISALLSAQVHAFLDCDVETKSIELGQVLRLDSDLEVRLPFRAGAVDESTRDPLSAVLSGQDRSARPVTAPRRGASSEEGVVDFSESRMVEVPRRLVTRRARLEASGAGILAGLRLQAAPVRRDVIELRQEAGLTLEFLIDGSLFLQEFALR